MSRSPDEIRPAPVIPWLTPRRTVVVCALLLLLFATLSFRAALTKSATFDEVVYAPDGYTYLHTFDFRVNPEHPPLWKYWASIPWLLKPPESVNLDSREYADICQDLGSQWDWARKTLYRTPGNDADSLLNRSRFMMTLLGVACGGLLGWWAYRLAGPIAAVAACAVYSLDPNFLAHASLVVNDVPVSLAMLAVACATWFLGSRITLVRALAVGLLCGVAVTTKLTAVLALPIVAVALAVRALLPAPWPMWRGESSLDTRPRRLLAALTLCATAAAIAFAWIWLCYGLRWQIAPDPAVHLNYDRMLREARFAEVAGPLRRRPTPDELRAWTPALPTRVIIYSFEHRLLPEAFLAGLWHAYAQSLYRFGWLFGEIYPDGRWYYFPVAFAVKTPLATLVALAGAAITGLATVLRRRSDSIPLAWPAACLLIPPALLGYAAIRSHVNIGLRHAFPVYVFIPLFVGLAAAHVFKSRPRLALAFLAVALAVETLPAYPDFIPFFNVAVGGSRGGFRILSDSNLDWGQDLPLVAAWQRDHPARTLHLAYFGTADPAYYHIRADMLTADNGSSVFDQPLPTSGVVAVSATLLQREYLRPGMRNPLAPLLSRTPTAVLGGTIYVYDLGGQ